MEGIPAKRGSGLSEPAPAEGDDGPAERGGDHPDLDLTEGLVP